MKYVRVVSFIFLVVLSVSIITLSQLDNRTTSKVYSSVSKALNIDLQALNIKMVQISDRGHIVAGFVLCWFSLMVIRRWWVTLLVMLFFLGIEVGQIFSVDRQASWIDAFRSWGGVLFAWGILLITKRFCRKKTSEEEEAEPVIPIL